MNKSILFYHVILLSFCIDCWIDLTNSTQIYIVYLLWCGFKKIIWIKFLKYRMDKSQMCYVKIAWYLQDSIKIMKFSQIMCFILLWFTQSLFSKSGNLNKITLFKNRNYIKKTYTKIPYFPASANILPDNVYRGLYRYFYQDPIFVKLRTAFLRLWKM